MPKLPALSGKELIKKLGKIGYEVVRQRGSHVRLRHGLDSKKKSLTVPLHSSLKHGLVHQILKDAGITLDELMKL